MRPFIAFVIIIFCLFPANARDLDEIKKSGKIRIAFTETDYNTINYPLAIEFARYLNVELEEVTIEWDQAFQINGKIPDDLKTNPEVSYTPEIFSSVDAIFSTFSILEWRKKIFGFSETLYSAELIMISEEGDAPKNYEELKGKSIAMMRGTSFESRISEINESIGGGITTILTENSDDAKNLLTSGDVWGVVLDADEALNFRINNNNEFKIGIPISAVSKTAYAVEKGNSLREEIENFFETISNNGVLDRIFNDMFGVTYSSYFQQISKNSRLELLNRDLGEILESKKLVVALRERNFVYKEGGPKQLMHALAEEFADFLGVQMEFVITPYFAKYWETDDGQVVRDSSYTPEWFNYYDVACEVIAPLDWRTNKVELVGIYPSEYTVIAKKDTRIRSIEDLKNLYGVTSSQTVYEQILLENGIDSFYFAKVNDYLSDIKDGKADYTIIYNAFFELSDYPELEVKLPLGELVVSWAVRKDQPELKWALEEFIKRSEEKGLINILIKAMRGQTLQTTEDFISSYYERFQTGQLPYVLYGVEDGLPQEDIFSIYQDKKGYMWFGTNSGVVKYNGREMKVWNTNNGLVDNTVLDIKQDTGGLMYFATSKGIAVFEEDSIVDNILEEVSFNNIFIDSYDTKWLLGDDGIYLIDPESNLTHFNDSWPELPDNIYDISEDPVTSDKYIASSEGIFIYSLADNTLTRVFDEYCYSIFIDVNDSVWISTQDGLFISSRGDFRSGQLPDRKRRLNKSLDVSGAIIKGIYQNSFGSVWLISDSEILQVLSTDQEAIKYEKEIGLNNNNILSFWVDLEDNIWIGFSGGLQRLTNKRGLRNFYPNTINSYIYSSFEDKYGRIWIASNNGIYYYSDNLVNFSSKLSSQTEKFCATLLPSGNILAASSEGLYEISANTLQVVRRRKFSNYLLSIENITVSENGEIFLLTGLSGVVYYMNEFRSDPQVIENKQTTNIYQLIDLHGTIIGGNKDEIVDFHDGNFRTIERIGCNIWNMCNTDDVLWMGSDCGLWKFEDGEYQKQNVLGDNTVVKAIVPAKNKNYLWLGTNNGFSYYNISNNEIEFTIDSKDGLPGNEITVGNLFIDANDLLWIGTYHGLSNFNLRAKATRTFTPLCYIERIMLNGEPIDKESGKIFRHFENNLIFEISGLSYSDERSIEYEFYLRGVENDYSSYHKGPEFKAYYPNLPAGKYEFIYKAKGKNNIWGYAQKYDFTVKKAWYHTWWFRIALIVLISFGAWSFYKIRVRAIEAQKNKLEQLVRERTHELEVANIEIEAQRDLATMQRDKISHQKKEIEDSIYYAQRIQQSLLPSKEFLDQLLPEHFIYFKPRDIVSGDFYWSNFIRGKLIITAADCTGHGVPGAFMSMLGIAFLNDIVNKQEQIDASIILDQLRNEIIQALGQRGAESESKDGMDMALCIIDRENKTLQFAGANNPLYHIRKKELMETKGDKMPVSIHETMPSFTSHTIELEEGDALYIFSDGYPDQFGGPREKKFMYKSFKNLLTDISDKSMQDQADILEKTMADWQGILEQIDDMVIIGIRI
ncbi:MAG TPA: transporter substrate-binding domain-containing protein [Bacteroides sp.]|nr:transporter substrate-binding domain-containing protein [Bacteroides sp.]